MQAMQFIQELVRIGQAREQQSAKPPLHVIARPDRGDIFAFEVRYYIVAWST